MSRKLDLGSLPSQDQTLTAHQDSPSPSDLGAASAPPAPGSVPTPQQPPQVMLEQPEDAWLSNPLTYEEFQDEAPGLLLMDMGRRSHEDWGFLNAGAGPSIQRGMHSHHLEAVSGFAKHTQLPLSSSVHVHVPCNLKVIADCAIVNLPVFPLWPCTHMTDLCEACMCCQATQKAVNIKTT